MPLSSPPNPVSGNSAILWAILEKISPFCLNPETKMGRFQSLQGSHDRQRRGANPLANSAWGISFFHFSVQTCSNRCRNTSVCLRTQENSVLGEMFSFNVTIILFCNRSVDVESFVPPFYKLMFPCPEKEKMNIFPLSPKLEDFRLSLLKSHICQGGPCVTDCRI